MLSEQITAQADGGEKIKVLSEFTSGIKAVAHLTVRGFALYLKKCRIELKRLNHVPALLFYMGNKLVCGQILDMDKDTGKINNIYTVVDPQKLRKL